MNSNQLVLFEDNTTPHVRHSTGSTFLDELRAFTWEGKHTIEESAKADYNGRSITVPLLVNEFWTSRQRAADSLHEVSYRACFKPQLPRFFIERLTEPGQTVYDPFSGRGTTALEAALLGRVPAACDVNPLSRILLEPRLTPPSLAQIASRLNEIPWSKPTTSEKISSCSTTPTLCARFARYGSTSARGNHPDVSTTLTDG